MPRTALTLVSGHGGRDKIVELTGVGPALIERRLASASADDRAERTARMSHRHRAFPHGAAAGARAACRAAIANLRDEPSRLARRRGRGGHRRRATTTSATPRRRRSAARSTTRSARTPSRSSARSTRRSQRIEDGTYGTCTACGKEIAPERLEAHPWASLCIDDASEGRARGERAGPARSTSASARRPTGSRPSRSPSGRSPPASMQWLALGGDRVRRDRRRPADEAHRHEPASQLDDGVHVVGPFWIHHVQNSGIAFGLLLERDGGRDRR